MHPDIKFITADDQTIPEGKIPVFNWESFPRSSMLRHISCHGQSRIRVRCRECSCEQEFYLWSMAGHGLSRCKGCGAMISYGGLHTIPATLYKAVDKARKLYHKNR
jgi:ribosomal protein S27E